MSTLIIREPTIEDKDAFILAIQSSQALHKPWEKSPQTEEEFKAYIKRSQLINQKCFLLCDTSKNIVGVFNVSELSTRHKG